MVRPTQLIHPQRAPAVARPAATVLLLRDGAQGVEVLMTRRAMSASFAPGAYVFPGGGIDAALCRTRSKVISVLWMFWAIYGGFCRGRKLHGIDGAMPSMGRFRESPHDSSLAHGDHEPVRSAGFSLFGRHTAA